MAEPVEGQCCTTVKMLGVTAQLIPRFNPVQFDNKAWWIKYFIGTTNIAGGLSAGSIQIFNTMTLAEVQASIDADLTYIAWKAVNPLRSITVTQWTDGVQGIEVDICTESSVQLATQGCGTMSQIEYEVEQF